MTNHRYICQANREWQLGLRKSPMGYAAKSDCCWTGNKPEEDETAELRCPLCGCGVIDRTEDE